MIMNQILDPIKVDLKPNLLNIVNTHQPNPYKSGYNFYIIPTKRQTGMLELIHTYLCGPTQTRYLGGASYFMTFINDWCRYTWVYFIRRKGDVFEYFKEFKTMIEK